ncbi:MAG: hypothetical protein HQL82_15215, partial [Magnetococcales bacterium]|nr:hypothetical protein [Magnetococcales bacterium]
MILLNASPDGRFLPAVVLLAAGLGLGLPVAAGAQTWEGAPPAVEAGAAAPP